MGQIMPLISVSSVNKTRDFYVESLGFEPNMAMLGSDGELDFCHLSREGAVILFSRGDGVKPTPDVQLYIEVSDVDGYQKKLAGSGILASEPETMWWGDRLFNVVDPNGYKLWFFQTVAEPSPPPGVKLV